MHISKIGFEKISALSYKDVVYQTQTETLKDFYSFSPDLKGIKEAIAHRSSFPIDRDLLRRVVTDHYTKVHTEDVQMAHIEKLAEANTFTVITAHQPCILGGPAYYFYKICSTIHLCKTLSQQFPDQHFVPVFVSGSEDHDFEEVKNLNVYGKTIDWQTDQTGPVGRFSLDGINETILKLSEILGEGQAAVDVVTIFQKAAKLAITYNDFVFQWLNAIFGKYGLLVVNMDDARLKKAFVPVMKKEILERKSESLVQATQDRLLQHNFKAQAFARDINLFYMSAGSRERILFEDGKYKVNNTSLAFSENEILTELDNFPERFSPNVVIRPLYQESILPNIAYIGGGGEIAYWLERKDQFKYFDVFFPVLIRRNSVMIISKSLQKSIDKLGLSEDELLLDDDAVITKYLEKAAATDIYLQDESKQLTDLFEQISSKAKAVDPTLEAYVLGESSKIVKTIESIESRIKRAVKQKEETAVNQIKTLKSKLFPNMGLQERVESFIPFMVSEPSDLLGEMIEILDPLEKEFLFVYL